MSEHFSQSKPGIEFSNSILLDAINAGLIVFDQNEKIACWNSWMQNHSGITYDAAYGKSLLDIFPEIENSRIQNAIQENLKYGMPAVISNLLNESVLPLYSNNPYRSVKNSQMYYHIQITRISGSTFPDMDKTSSSEESQSYCLMYITDVSASVMREKLLENQIKERKHANASNRSKSTFLANMSHELRTPMHGILSFVNLGIDHPERLTTKKTLEYFSHIKTSATRLMVLLNDLLDLSKLETGKMEINFKQNALQLVAESCVMEQRARLIEQQKEIVFDTNNISGKANFDVIRIGQVITNFLSNAIKFSPKNTTINIIISESEIEINNKIFPALLYVTRDHGDGILDGEHEVVFDKFVQGSNLSTGTTKSTGLGLAICKEIIELHHGKIWAENHPDGGAIFSFLIPVEQTFDSNDPAVAGE